ncbi:MAG: glycosyltransferase family 4 protein [Candidatus Bathyarchaeia archaeon]
MVGVGIIHYTAPPKAIGGVEIVIDHHVNYLSKAGYKMHVIYGEGGGLGYRDVVEHKLPLLSPNNPRIQSLQEQILKEKKKTPEFEDVKKSLKEDLTKILSEINTCIVHNIPSMPFNFAATAAINELVEQLKLKKVIYWLHDSVLLREEWKNMDGNFPFTLLHYKNPKIIFVTPTSFRAKQFARLPEPYKIDKVMVVPNGVSLEEYIKIDETTKLLMKKLGLSFDNYIIVTPVRVTPRKNIELALFVVDELKHLMEPIRPIKLLITGPVDHQSVKMGMLYMEYLKELIDRRGLHENVIFCHEYIAQKREYREGHIVKWSVGDIYNIADLVFIPSREEGFGLPVIEAGAARKAIFCSRIPPFQELIRDDIEGYMFDLTESPKSIALRIYREFLNDRIANNFINVLKRFSWESIITSKLIPLLS